MSILSQFRGFREAVEDLAGAVRELRKTAAEIAELHRESAPSEARLEALERTRAHWEAEMDALVLKAESTLKSAANAESRSRTMLRHAEKLADPLDFEGEEEPEAIPAGYGTGGEEERLQPVPLGVAPTRKQLALRAKFA